MSAALQQKFAEPREDLPHYRFSVEQYHQMIEAGVLIEDARVELLEGRIVRQMTHLPPHDVSVDLTDEALRVALPKGWRTRVQSAITTRDSEPEPDIAVVRGPARRYLKSHPRRRDIGMLVEVAEKSLRRDRTVKARIYARERIPIYWIINLIERHVEVYTQPHGGKSPGYNERQDYGPDDVVALVIEGKECGRVRVGDLLP